VNVLLSGYSWLKGGHGVSRRSRQTACGPTEGTYSAKPTSHKIVDLGTDKRRGFEIGGHTAPVSIGSRSDHRMKRAKETERLQRSHPATRVIGTPTKTAVGGMFNRWKLGFRESGRGRN
jgi:hypothetical protein